MNFARFSRLLAFYLSIALIYTTGLIAQEEPAADPPESGQKEELKAAEGDAAEGEAVETSKTEAAAPVTEAEQAPAAIAVVEVSAASVELEQLLRELESGTEMPESIEGIEPKLQELEQQTGGLEQEIGSLLFPVRGQIEDLRTSLADQKRRLEAIQGQVFRYAKTLQESQTELEAQKTVWELTREESADVEVINWTLRDFNRRIEIAVGVAYGTDPEQTIEVLQEVVAANKDILEDPAPVITFDSFGDSALLFTVRCWTADFGEFLRLRSELNVAIVKAFKEAGITIPFPQRDLHVRMVKDARESTETGGDPLQS